MKRLAMVLLAAMLLAGCSNEEEGLPEADAQRNVEAAVLKDEAIEKAVRGEDLDRELLLDLAALAMAYPGIVTDAEKDGEYIYVLLASGERILYDDKKEKDFEAQLSGADLQDMLALAYPLEASVGIPEAGSDPGRIRCYPFFDALYGSSREEISARQVRVAYGSQSLRFSGAAGAAQALAAAAGAVEKIVEAMPEAAAYAYPSAGAYYYRTIAGTERLSAHAYGIAIDLAEHPDDYWQKTTVAAGAARLAGYPMELVQAFEDQGFIWGGKWHHFDLLHYEYRPELVMKARLLKEGAGSSAMKKAAELVGGWLDGG